MNSKINTLILQLLKQKPNISIFQLTAIASFFSLFLAISVLYIIDIYFVSFDISIFYYKLTAFCSVFNAIIITPLFSYRLLNTTHERNSLLDRLDYISKYDDLTNIKNRRFTLELANMELRLANRHKTPFSIIILDYDKFKDINDTFGHHIGDEVLKKFASIIQLNIRQSDIFGRYGGDEFILFCPYTNLKLANLVANKIKNALDINIKISDKNIKMSASLGCATLHLENDESIIDLIQKADKALYLAKNNGRNRVEQIFD